MLCHVLYDALNGDIDRVLNYAFIQVSNYVLNDTELLEKFASRIQHFVREHILLTIHPQVGEAFLCRVKNLGQVAQRAFFV